MRYSFSDKTQWNILAYLFDIYPLRLTEKDFRKKFGNPARRDFIANIHQLIEDGLIENKAIEVICGEEKVSPFNLRLTKEGLQLMNNSGAERS